LAPEIIHVFLGLKWSQITIPFQILTMGMLFRTSYKVSDSLVRATGAVYQRAYRQAIYALLVLGGAWIGHHWGISGVAFGILAAIATNFLLMSQMSLTLIGMSWRTFLTAHLPGICLATLVYFEVWVVAMVMRNLAMSPILLLVVSSVLGFIAMFLSIRFVPSIFLGQDGIWMIKTLLEYVPGRFNYLGWTPKQGKQYNI